MFRPANLQYTHDISADTLLIDSERLHRQLHTVEAGRFPNEVHSVVVSDVHRDPLGPPKLQANLVRYVYR